MPFDPNGIGELGKDEFVKNQDNPDVAAKVKAGWDAAQFNEYLSDQISVERSLKDVKDPASVCCLFVHCITYQFTQDYSAELVFKCKKYCDLKICCQQSIFY